MTDKGFFYTTDFESPLEEEQPLLPDEELVTTTKSALADLRHALRTSLNAIIGYSEMLLEDAEETQADQFLPDLQRIREASQVLLSLVNHGLNPMTLEAENISTVVELSERNAPAGRRREKVEFGEAHTGSLLVVDDIESNRDLLTRYLTRLGHRVALAENGKEALKKIHDQQFDAVLLDIKMPEMNGIDVLEHLKNEGVLRDVPIIMISALDEMEGLVECIEMGAEDFLPKPFDPILLKARINACLEKKRLRDLQVEYLQNIARMAEETAREKAKFMRIMVHELKSPVSAAKMMADLLETLSPDSPKFAKLPARISSRMEELMTLIKDILELAKIEAGEPLGEVVVLNLVDETRKSYDQYREQAEEKGLTIGFDCQERSLEVKFDSLGCELLLSNILSNAVKFTSAGHVAVELSRQDTFAVLEVSDSGIGIPEADIPSLFKEFFRASNAKKRNITGSGVGLAGVKHIVERFDGEIEVKSRENEGTTFIVRLPLAVSQESPQNNVPDNLKRVRSTNPMKDIVKFVRPASLRHIEARFSRYTRSIFKNMPMTPIQSVSLSKGKIVLCLKTPSSCAGRRYCAAPSGRCACL